MTYLYLGYVPQLLQLEALQLEQELPPIEDVEPPPLLEKQAKLDKALLARPWQ